MGTAERRNEIVKVLCRRRYEKIGNLASEFGVSERTIRRDIEILSFCEPIYTLAGRYGGVYVIESYSPNKMYMSERESEVLHKAFEASKCKSQCVLTEEELSIFSCIISNYTKPQLKKGKQK